MHRHGISELVASAGICSRRKQLGLLNPVIAIRRIAPEEINRAGIGGATGGLTERGSDDDQVAIDGNGFPEAVSGAGIRGGEDGHLTPWGSEAGVALIDEDLSGIVGR